MKKKIIILSAAFMLLAGTVSASSINGDYKGNPIVKVLSNGNQLETDEVPAMIYDGHTVVPISLLRQIGASVTWNAETYSVDVKLNNQTNTNTPKNQINELKSYSKAAEYYRKLMLVGESIGDFATYVISAVNVINGSNAANSLHLAETQYDHANEMLNITLNEANTVYDELINAGVDISDVKSILIDYSLALRQYGNALESAEKLYKSGSQRDFDNYSASIGTGINTLNSPRIKSNDKYFEWYNKVQNY